MAYSTSFYFIGRKGGIERKWMMYEAEDEQNKIDLLYEKATTERNGVKVIVPVKFNDKNNFCSKIKEQLAYFEDVYFNVTSFAEAVEGISNNFLIQRNENFQFSSLSADSFLHICLDNVYYELDFNKLGIKTIYAPIALRFSLTDGIFPVPNREQIRYSEEAKKTIIAKIGKVADFFVQRYNNNINNTDKLTDIIAYYKTTDRNVDIGDTLTFSITDLAAYSNIPIAKPRLNGVKLINLEKVFFQKDSLFVNYDILHIFRRNKYHAVKDSRWEKIFNYDKSLLPSIYVYSDKINKQKKDYIKELQSGNEAYFIKKKSDIKLGSIGAKYSTTAGQNYRQILELDKYPRKEWRERIKEWQYVFSLASKHFVDLDTLVVPQTWTDDRKALKVSVLGAKGITFRKKKLEGEVNGKFLRDPEKYINGKNSVLEPITIKLKTAHKEPYLLIYGDQSQKDKMDKWFTVFDKIKVKFVIFTERELKLIKDIELHNWIKMEEFEKGKHIVFKRAVTAYLISELYSKYPKVFQNSQRINAVSSQLAENIDLLSTYKNKHHKNGSSDLYKIMLSVAQEYNLFDTSIYDVYKNTEITFSKLPFLNPVFNTMGGYYGNAGEAMEPVIRDLFRYYKMKIDWIHYKVKLNEESTTELTEETIEELEQTI